MGKLSKSGIHVIGTLDMLVRLEGPGAGWYHFQTKTASANTKPAMYSAKVAMSLHEAIYAQAAIKAGYTPYKGRESVSARHGSDSGVGRYDLGRGQGH